MGNQFNVHIQTPLEVYSIPDSPHEASNARDGDNPPLSGNDQGHELLDGGHDSEEIGLEHGADLGHVGLCGGAGASYRIGVSTDTYNTLHSQ